MFTLVTGAYKYFMRQDEYNILMLGLDGAGKTTLLEKIKHIDTGIPGMPPDKIQPTVGVNIAKVTHSKDVVKFMDLGGQADLRGIWESYYEDSHAILFAIDAADRERMKEARDVLDQLIRVDELEGLPLLVAANKCDLEDAELVGVKEMINEMADRLDERDVRVMETSGIEGTGITAAMEWLHSRIIDNKDNKPPVVPEL
ncbi:ADP-ribosylation factor protein 3 [Coemansia asiatica]|uniref:ADP-ribosylation factor protein 3 n=1 Tax=Coemansia asiatica TaxID=1052880 RepID=A0A9W7XHD5_9FUNG|nr:ADP-ribosylation factor protein 3 [Coemansia asiatica]KAJ2887830.1 ADP-ribosylation factor protein 3 [Coemansia asiatica]